MYDMDIYRCSISVVSDNVFYLSYNLPARRVASAEVLLATLRFLVLGDGDGAGVIIGLYNNDEATEETPPEKNHRRSMFFDVV